MAPIGNTARLGRLRAESLMVSTCTIDRPGTPTEGPGGVITVPYTGVYSGKCRIKPGAPHGERVEIGEAGRVVARTLAWLPVSAPDVLEGDRLTITANAADTNLIGKTFRVRAVARSSTPTRTEVELIEVTS